MIWGRLGQAIGDVHLRVDLLDLELLVDKELPNVIIPHLYVLRLSLVDWISPKVYCAL